MTELNLQSMKVLAEAAFLFNEAYPPFTHTESRKQDISRSLFTECLDLHSETFGTREEACCLIQQVAKKLSELPAYVQGIQAMETVKELRREIDRILLEKEIERLRLEKEERPDRLFEVEREPTLCETMKECSSWTWNRLREASEIKIHLGEESLTDFNLLKIRLLHNREVFTSTFSKLAESREGADWEWWFLDKALNRALGFRVQAKVIGMSGTFDHLYYANKKGLQVETLCERALKSKTIPIYCLYSFFENTLSINPTITKSGLVSLEDYGCSIMDAFRVLDYARKHKPNKISDLFLDMIPWHLLFCSSQSSTVDLPTRALKAWSNHLPESANIAASEMIVPPPDYVKAMVESRVIYPPDPTIGQITVFVG